MRTHEQMEVLGIFHELLEGPTGDGGAKRGRGEKPSWKVDDSHWDAAFRHINRYIEDEEMHDKDSGVHPLIHASWRLLAVAYQDMVEAGEIPVDPPHTV